MGLNNVKAIILAAGKGERMLSSRAKVLHEVAGWPIVRHVLNAVRAAGISDIAVVVGVQADAVREAVGEGVTFIDQSDPKGTGDAVIRCRPVLEGFGGETVILCGDAPLVSAETIQGMVRGFREKKADVLMLTACIDDPRGYGRVARDQAGKFVRIVEEADASEQELGIQEVNSGAYVFRTPKLLSALEGLKADNKKGEYYLTDILKQFVAEGKSVETARPPDPVEVYGINTRKDLVAAGNYLRWRVMDYHMSNGVTVVDPSTSYIEADVEIGRDTIIHPFCVIRATVRVGAGCQVGPFAHLRAGAVLADGAEIGDYVEVKNSTIGAGTKAKHLAYIGDATLGAGVNIGAGTITANYDRGKKSRTTIEDGVHTGCNTVLVAPVTLRKNSRTGAGTVVPRGKDVPEGTTVVGVPAHPLKRSKR